MKNEGYRGTAANVTSTVNHQVYYRSTKAVHINVSVGEILNIMDVCWWHGDLKSKQLR